jgi:hypothetical protein
LRDNSTPEIAQVRLRTGITQYSLHKSVRAVVSARYDTQNYDLWRVGHALLGNTVVDTERPFGLDDTSTTGAPTAYSTDESLDFEDDHAIILRVFSMPTAVENGKVIYLRTARSPLYPLDYDKIETQELEIPHEFCLDMLEWAAYRAMRTSDLDGHATQAEAHKLRFEEAVAEQLKTNRTKRRQPMFFAPGIAGMP